MQNTKLFIDFDSTFTKVEALEALLQFSIPDETLRQPILEQIEDLTNQGMEGRLDYMESLDRRMALLNADRNDVTDLIDYLYTQISDSIKANKDYLLDNKESIYIISNGFEDFIKPVIARFGLNPDQVYANRFIYDENGKISGVDKANPLAGEAGKPKVIKSLNLPDQVIMLGDGFNDYQAKQGGAADQFILFTENIRRDSVVPLADKVAESFDEVIEIIEQ